MVFKEESSTELCSRSDDPQLFNCSLDIAYLLKLLSRIVGAASMLSELSRLEAREDVLRRVKELVILIFCSPISTCITEMPGVKYADVCT